MQGFGKRLIGLAPLRHSHLFDVFLLSLGDDLIEMRGPGRTHQSVVHGRPGHHGGGLGHGVAEVVQLLDMGIVELAEVIPDGRFGGDYVGLVAAVDDDVMRALLEPQVLAAEFPPDVHQVRGVEGAAPLPGCASSVGSLAVKEVLHGDQPAELSIAGRIRRGEFMPDVHAEDNVHILEQADADVKRL